MADRQSLNATEVSLRPAAAAAAANQSLDTGLVAKQHNSTTSASSSPHLGPRYSPPVDGNGLDYNYYNDQDIREARQLGLDDLFGGLSHSGYGHKCKKGIPVEQALFAVLAAALASFGFLFRAVTQAQGRRRRRRRREADGGGGGGGAAAATPFVQWLLLGRSSSSSSSYPWLDRLSCQLPLRCQYSRIA